jgi:hypothetical protein
MVKVIRLDTRAHRYLCPTEFDAASIANRFLNQCETIDPEVSSFVYEKVLSYQAQGMA